MQTFILRFPSITYAQKASRELEKRGIRARLTRGTTHGCSYGLEIHAQSPEYIQRILDEEGIIYSL